ncbi:class A beta-lactamase-related serine hydrolase [Stagnimonas aquatica]|uniref:Class A beta-lactamase-related serine hydrolase n=1 Tax=Stagnimonas aquatica TaxID=2689987 RepID=A0A3N0V150_9GAMM|nr:serine hydrolase domain-containing protein [Stagnimonas aquatica]ROH86527.1 class A beta-lactamase-related serine hydrolase [Stagnimonas aquatica]
MNSRAFLIAAFSLLALAACGESSNSSPLNPGGGEAALKCALPSADGGDDFQTAEPEALALDPAAVSQALLYATSTNAQSIRIYRHGCLAGKGALDTLTESIPNNVWSTTKGVTSMLVGRAVTLGKLRLDDSVGRYLPEADAEHAAITVRQLLTQSSGLHFNYTGDLLGVGGPDTVRYTLALPFDSAPGTDFTYGQTTVTLLAKLVEVAVGEDLQDFAQRELFGPLGIAREDWFWLRDRAGNTHGYAFLFIAPKHLARLGHLMLNGGVWNGGRLIDSGYVHAAGEPSATNPFYGYLLWSNRADSGYPVEFLSVPQRVEHPLVASAPRDLYMFVGFLDQIVFVIPSLDMVVVRTGLPGNYELDVQTVTSAHPGRWMHEFFRILMRGVKDQTIADPGPYAGYDTPAPLDLQYWVDPVTILGQLSLGPQAPPGCNLLGCEGGISYEGLVQSLNDATCALLKLCL